MADNTPLTVGEFDRTMNAMRREMRDGFTRINGRLNRHGDALTEHGKLISRQDERLETLEERADRAAVPAQAVVTTAPPKDSDAAVLALTVSKPMMGLLATAATGLQFLVLALAKWLGFLQ